MNSPKSSRLEALPAPQDHRPGFPLEWVVRARNWAARRILGLWQSVLSAIALFQIRPPETPQVLQRIQRMERDIVLPAKVAAIAILIYNFYFTHWVVDKTKILEVPLEYAHYYLWFWIAANVATAWVLFSMRALRPKLVEWTVFTNNLLDGIFLGVLTLGTLGYNSPLYWIYLALIARTAVSVPRPTSQLVANLTLTTYYVLAGKIDSLIGEQLGTEEAHVAEIYSGQTEPLVLRLALLLLMTFACYAIQVLLERQRQVAEEAREFAVREVQLRSAGRLAAEFAHQIKNPLAIINNATFSLQKALREGKPANSHQIQMIQEEVERADRIITQVMGYAQLSEGHIERLQVLDELENAIDRVFPPVAAYPVEVERRYAPDFPPLFMQKRHAAETFINVLQNAREALGKAGGKVVVTAEVGADHSIQVSIADNGPGIPRDRLSRVFEAYYTTKDRGTGLGLATVRNNIELYGGNVRVESELGKGARFVLMFPAKTLIKSAEIM